MASDASNSGISRRGLLAGTVGLAFLASLGIDLAQTEPASADPLPTTPAAMASLALSLQGQTLAQLQSTVMTQSPYGAYQGDWCAVFAGWLTRAVVSWQSSYSYAVTLYQSQTQVSNPQVGDFIYYQGSGVQHIGVVVDISNGVRTVEGNTHTHPWNVATVNSYNPPWNEPPATKYYSRPNWGSSGGVSGYATRESKDMIFLRYTSASPNIWIALDLVHKQYRLIPAGGFEDQLLSSMVSSGELTQHNIADPVWGQTFGNGQFTQVQ